MIVKESDAASGHVSFRLANSEVVSSGRSAFRNEMKTSSQLVKRRPRVVSTQVTSFTSARPAPVWCSYCRIIVTMLYQACT